MAITGMTGQLMTAPGEATNNMRASEVVLRTRNLSKQYGKRLAVDNLTLEVHRGEIFGFLGPNGAGKTTTIRMALGLIAPTSGSVEILGQDVFTHRAQVLPRVGALVETPALYTYLSGRNNLRAVASVLGGVPKARLDAVLDLVGLGIRQKDRVRTYSLGMKQRLGVAMALLQERRSEEHTSELQSLRHLVCRLLLEKKKKIDSDLDVVHKCISYFG